MIAPTDDAVADDIAATDEEATEAGGLAAPEDEETVKPVDEPDGHDALGGPASQLTEPLQAPRTGDGSGTTSSGSGSGSGSATGSGSTAGSGAGTGG